MLKYYLTMYFVMFVLSSSSILISSALADGGIDRANIVTSVKNHDDFTSNTTTVGQYRYRSQLTPEQIRQMPLLARPNRPGHIYGNTIRRLYYGRRR